MLRIFQFWYVFYILDRWRGLKDIEGVSNALGYNSQLLYYVNHKYKRCFCV